MNDQGFSDVAKARAVAISIASKRKRSVRASLRHENWATAKQGPLPFAIFCAAELDALIRASNPATALLKGLWAAQANAELSIVRLSVSHPEPTRCVRLSLLRWLTGERDTGGEAPESGEPHRAPSPTSLPDELVEDPASPLYRSNPRRSHRAKQHQCLPGQGGRPRAERPDLKPELQAAQQSCANSERTDAAPSIPPHCDQGGDDNAAPSNPHRLSETPE